VSRAHFFRKATDDQGNVVPGTILTVYQPGTLAFLADPLYVNEVGGIELTNPVTIDDGIIDFYLDQPTQVKIGLRAPGGVERFYDNQDVYPDPQTVVQAPDGLQITNSPVAGNFLQATGPRQATWVTAPELQTAALTPVQTLRQQIFSSQSLSDLTLRRRSGPSIAPTFIDVNSDPKPNGFLFTHALDWNTSEEMVLTAPSELFVEGGHVQFLYKTIAPAAGKTPAIIRVTLDDADLWVQTPTLAEEFDVWAIGYLGNIPPGSHTIRFHHLPGSDGSSRTLLGSIEIQYGGMVPAHAHEGGGLLSTMVGPDASANFTGATALGGQSTVAGPFGTAVGASASAQDQGTAVGANSAAADEGVAVGYQARTSPSTVGAVALGRNAAAQATGAVAAGPDSVVSAVYGVAVGKTSRAGQDAVAIGHDATATGLQSVALGAGAAATHGHAVALGPGAQTSAANQLMLGTDADTTVIPGDLRQAGDVVLGSADSVVGFFGEGGGTRPVVTGSRGGNAVLTALISHLATLGLIIDNTTT
jgi:hypothetical protein